MPVIKSAIKKLRRDKKREKVNDEFRKKLDKTIKEAKNKKTPSSINSAFSLVDRAVKNNLMHKNRASRIKSSLAKLAKPGSAKKPKPEPAKKKTPGKKPARRPSSVKSKSSK